MYPSMLLSIELAVMNKYPRRILMTISSLERYRYELAFLHKSRDFSKMVTQGHLKSKREPGFEGCLFVNES
jgi:hypothetical protein